MKVAFCAAEVAPFSQAGGLGDVAGSLPAAISRFKTDNPVEIIILTPLYGLIDRQKYGLVQTDLSFSIQLAGKGYSIGIWQSQLPNSTVPVYFMENQELFGDREQVYPYGRPEWELEGFLVFNQAVFELLRRLNFRPDILHVHDWHTGSIAATLSDIRPFDQYFSRTYSVLTIHNLSYQGIFGETNCLREGILKSNAVTTVSPTYAQEILTPRFGAGLDEVLRPTITRQQMRALQIILM
jgi:starch synthase